MGFNEQQLSIFERNISESKRRTAAKKEKENHNPEIIRLRGAAQLQEQPDTDSVASEGLEAVPSLRQKADVAPHIANKRRVQAMDEKLRYRFRFTVIVSVSDMRARDVNGPVSTLLDCVRDAVKEFVTLYPEYLEWAKDHLPFDDSFLFIPVLNVVWTPLVPPGCEGATVYLERLTETQIADWRAKCELGAFMDTDLAEPWTP